MIRCSSLSLAAFLALSAPAALAQEAPGAARDTRRRHVDFDLRAPYGSRSLQRAGEPRAERDLFGGIELDVHRLRFDASRRRLTESRVGMGFSQSNLASTRRGDLALKSGYRGRGPNDFLALATVEASTQSTANLGTESGALVGVEAGTLEFGTSSERARFIQRVSVSLKTGYGTLQPWGAEEPRTGQRRVNERGVSLELRNNVKPGRRLLDLSVESRHRAYAGAGTMGDAAGRVRVGVLDNQGAIFVELSEKRLRSTDQAFIRSAHQRSVGLGFSVTPGSVSRAGR
jgi:hypothetical protein